MDSQGCVPNEIKRFNCMTPISVSRRSITKCLCGALNVCPSAIICRLLSSKYFKKPRTALSINAAIATICKNYQCVQERSPGPDGTRQGSEGPNSIISSSALSSAAALRIDKEQTHCIALWDLLCRAKDSTLSAAPQVTTHHVSSLTRRDTKALSTENGVGEEIPGWEIGCSKVYPMKTRHEGNCHKHTEMFAEAL